MSVLYRKYRPKTFSEVVGQENIVKTITNAIKQGRISHAYLFYGPRGCGKTTLARLIAKALNCQKRKEGSFEPCNECISCFEINEGNAIDLIEIDAASNRGIDEIRDLKEGISVVPVKSKYKVYIIDEAHQLTKEASNALLKTLEEPPKYAVFILCTTEYVKIIPTIASRCQQFEFKKFTIPEIVKKLEFICKKEQRKCEKEALELIAKKSEGAIRDAESFLNKVFALEDKEIKKDEVKEILGIVGTESLSKLVDLIAKKDEKEAIAFVNEINQSGFDIETFVREFNSYLRNLLLIKVNPEIFNDNEIFTKEEEKALLAQREFFSESQLVEILKIFIDVQNQIKWQDIPILPLELGVIDSINVLKR
jgi:DNA polymerase-3 subunit gamma/tau